MKFMSYNHLRDPEISTPQHKQKNKAKNELPPSSRKSQDEVTIDASTLVLTTTYDPPGWMGHFPIAGLMSFLSHHE